MIKAAGRAALAVLALNHAAGVRLAASLAFIAGRLERAPEELDM
jgi:hypothetical protein